MTSRGQTLHWIWTISYRLPEGVVGYMLTANDDPTLKTVGPSVFTDRQTDTHTHRHTDRHTDTHTDRKTDRQTGRQYFINPFGRSPQGNCFLQPSTFVLFKKI